MIWLGHRFRLQHAVARYLSAREADFFAAGGALICGCFFAGDNGLYRGIYFLFALPASADAGTSAVFAARRAQRFGGRASQLSSCFGTLFFAKGIRVAVKALGNPVDFAVL